MGGSVKWFPKIWPNVLLLPKSNYMYMFIALIIPHKLEVGSYKGMFFYYGFWSKVC